jgi:uncharacterized membrane protein SpoIIM required for sporulation
MVLEMLTNPKRAERRPWEMFFIGLLYASIAVFLSNWIFQKYASLVMVFLTILAPLLLVQNTLKLEEEKDKDISSELILLKEHSKALSYFMFLFLGFVIAYTFWYMVLPSHMISNLFGTQIETIEAINSLSRAHLSFSGAPTLLSQIFLNNSKVLFFCLLFAFFYGAGSIFILAWNASVVGAAMGSFMRTNLAAIARDVGFVGVSHYFSTFSLSLFRYFTHGFFEILAYFMAALGGGIISIAIARHEFGTEEFKHIAMDSLDLIVLAVFLLFFAALVEVYVTPLLF